MSRTEQGYIYSATEAQCREYPQKQRCTAGPARRLFVHWEEPARQAVRASPAPRPMSARAAPAIRVEALFAELTQRLRVERVRLRRLWNVAEQFHLAATAQNLKRLVQFLARGQPGPVLGTT